MKESLVLLKIGNAPVVGTKEYDIEESYVKDAELKLLDVKLEEREWVILNLLHQLLISGISRAFQAD